MSLRLLKILAADEHREEVLEILDENGESPRWIANLADDRVVIEVVLPASGNEPVLDALEERFRGDERFRLLFLALEATVPRIEEEDEPEGDEEEESPGGGSADGEPDESGQEDPRTPSRINREELRSDISDLARGGWYFLVMSGLSSVVATAGLLLGDGAVIIGAMVIAPLIGPSMGTAFATTLGDLSFGWSTLKASIWGAIVAFAVAFLAGLAFEVDPLGAEIVGRTRLTYEHLALALAAGTAGALAITQGTGAGLVGVMVAVALLPPLANAGLLLGDGHLVAGAGALVLMAGNVVSVNLAATVTFLALGVRPNTWWEEGIRTRAVWIASILWGFMLLVLGAIVWFAWGGEAPGLPG